MKVLKVLVYTQLSKKMTFLSKILMKYMYKNVECLRLILPAGASKHLKLMNFQFE